MKLCKNCKHLAAHGRCQKTAKIDPDFVNGVDIKSDDSELAKTWDGYPDYSTWIAGPHNNADIAGEDEYNSLIPFFQKLFDLSHQKFPAFYARAEAIANLPKIERYIEIEKIMAK